MPAEILALASCHRGSSCSLIGHDANYWRDFRYPWSAAPQALAALAGCDPIIHAGDIGSPDVLARLGALAPVHAVRGNVDHGAWSANLSVTQRIECGDANLTAADCDVEP